jgi:hypothetical protein
MTEPTRPRGIRDIAHLYLSRQASRARPAPIDLWVVGEDRRCFPGFHTANLAAALVASKVHVRVFELSRLVLNSAFYFCLPPEAYLSRPASSDRRFVPAMNGVSIVFDSVGLMGETDGSDNASVNLIHLPPLAPDEPFMMTAEELGRRSWADRWGIYLYRGEAGGGAASLGRWLDAKGVFELSMADVPPSAYLRGHLGTIPHWQTSVADRIPCVVRDPRSRLSRAYLSVVESLLARIHAVRRRRIDGPRPELTASESSRR